MISVSVRDNTLEIYQLILALHKRRCLTLLALYISLLHEMMFVYLLPGNLQSAFLRTFQRNTCTVVFFMNLLRYVSTKCEKQLNQPQRNYNFHLSQFQLKLDTKRTLFSSWSIALFTLHDCEGIQREYRQRRKFGQSFYRNG